MHLTRRGLDLAHPRAGRGQLGRQRARARLRALAPQLTVLQVLVADPDQPRGETLPRAVLESTSSVQYSSGTNASISSSRSHRSRSATRLHPPGRQSEVERLPQQRAHLVADQTVEHAPRLLGVDQVHVERPRVLERLLHRALGDLVEGQPLDRLFGRLEHRSQVPGDRLALAVGIGREVNALGGLGRGLEPRDRLILAHDRHVLGLEVVLDVDTELALRQVHDVAVGSEHGEFLPEELGQRARLGRRLDDDQRFPGGTRRRLGARLLRLGRRLLRRLGTLGRGRGRLCGLTTRDLRLVFRHFGGGRRSPTPGSGFGSASATRRGAQCATSASRAPPSSASTCRATRTATSRAVATSAGCSPAVSTSRTRSN